MQFDYDWRDGKEGVPQRDDKLASVELRGTIQPQIDVFTPQLVLFVAKEEGGLIIQRRRLSLCQIVTKNIGFPFFDNSNESLPKLSRDCKMFRRSREYALEIIAVHGDTMADDQARPQDGRTATMAQFEYFRCHEEF